MNCPIDKRQFKNKKSLSNHTRWHNGISNKGKHINVGESNPAKRADVRIKISNTVKLLYTNGVLDSRQENNGNWKGEDVGYDGLHTYIKRHLIKPSICNNCGKKKLLDLANISGEYKRELTDWEWLCRKCHMTKDGRLIKLHSLKKSMPSGENHWRYKNNA